MSPAAIKYIQIVAKEAGDHLKDKLPGDHRNSYAHIWERIKSKMGKSYKECSDDQLDEILEIIAWHRENPC